MTQQKPKRKSPTRSQPAHYALVADAVERTAVHAQGDPDHPWSRQWPTISEMARYLGESQPQVVQAIAHLRRRGVFVHALIHTDDGVRRLSVLTSMMPSLPQAHTETSMRTELLSRTKSGEWSELPPLHELATHFGRDRRAVRRVLLALAEQGRAVHVRRGQSYRWQIVGQDTSIEPALLVRSVKAVAQDMIRRIRAGEFRYRLPDGTVHEAALPGQDRMTRRYRVGYKTLEAVKAHLHLLEWIEPAPSPYQQGGTVWVLASRVPPVDLDHHPAGVAAVAPPPAKWTAVADIVQDLIGRIVAGEFDDAPLPTREELKVRYRVGAPKITRVHAELAAGGWIVTQPPTAYRVRPRVVGPGEGPRAGPGTAADRDDRPAVP